MGADHALSGSYLGIPWRVRDVSNAVAAVRYNFAVALGRARDFNEARELQGNLLMAGKQAAAALPHFRAWAGLQPESAQAQLDRPWR